MPLPDASERHLPPLTGVALVLAIVWVLGVVLLYLAARELGRPLVP